LRCCASSTADLPQAVPALVFLHPYSFCKQKTSGEPKDALVTCKIMATLSAVRWDPLMRRTINSSGAREAGQGGVGRLHAQAVDHRQRTAA
jgi:hypothetical protein